MHKILVLDDNPAVLTSLSILLDVNGYESVTASHPAQALDILEHESVSVVIADMNYKQDTTSGEEGIQFFYTARKSYPDLPIILITAWVELSTAVELAKAGAADYLSKPWDDNKLLISIKNLVELSELQEQHHQASSARKNVKNQLEEKYDLGGIIYESDSMLQLLRTALQVAKADVPILITGANGTGKEKIAEVVQRNSSVSDGAFIKVNAGAIPIDLMEAEIFGAEPGAYTGAQKTRIGYFEKADGGTLFLDEIGNLPLSGQMKLLRIIQTGEYQRLGSSHIRKCNVRLITATNTDLTAAIAQGTFREDLYYRLNVIEFHLAPLCERKEDIAPLTRFFLKGHSVSPEAMRVIEAYEWPGNVRELQNAIQRAVLLAQGKPIGVEELHLPKSIKPRKRPLFEPDEEQLRNALNSTSSIAEAARSIGLSRQAFYRRLKKYGIQL